jgi:Fur family ferric uptake transcriptional regulator
MNKKYKEALLTLQKAGLSKTPQRLAVLDILLNATTPLSVRDISQTLAARARIDRVTIYRILSLFKQHGIAREIASSGGTNYFEMASLENPVHPHFNCRNCGELSCMEPLTFSQSRQLISGKEDYSVDHIEINISGLCAVCRNATKLQKQQNKQV